MSENSTNPLKLAPVSPDRLVRQAAHDLRSPLSAIKIVAAKIGVEHESSGKLLLAAAQRLEDIVNELTSSMESLAREVSTRELKQLVASVVDEKRFAHPLVDLQFHHEDFGADITCAPEKLQRILSNLLNNSIEALERRLENPKILVTMILNAERSRALLTIEDNGHGIPPHILPRLGKSRLSYGKDSSGTRGLGLSDARRALTEWGGSLTISRHNGLGTTVTLALPANCQNFKKP